MNLFAVSVALLFAACGSNPPVADSGVDMGNNDPDTTVATDTATDDSAVVDVRPDLPLCTRYADHTALGTVSDPRITEVSGIAASRTQDLLWVHNDSGEVRATFYALSKTGETLATYEIDGARAVDWEDMAIAQDAGKAVLYFADIGDNPAREGGNPRQFITVYRVVEPDVTGADPMVPIVIDEFEIYRLSYPDTPHDAEALMVDPITLDLYLVAKENTPGSNVYRAPRPTDGVPTELQLIGNIPFGTQEVPGTTWTTAATISPTGNAIVIRTYLSVLLWEWEPGKSFAQAIEALPITLPVPVEFQGESIDFAADESGIYSIGEGTGSEVNFSAAMCN